MSDLTANKTFYVRTDGNDTNNGLTSGNAFLTPQRAADETLKWRTGEFTLTVDIGEGEFDCDSALTLSTREGENIVWNGNVISDPADFDGAWAITPTTSATSLGNGLEYIDFDIDFSNADGDLEIAAGQYISVRYYDYATAYGELFNGCHEVIAWNSGTERATVRCVRAAGSGKFPASVSGLVGIMCVVVKTILNFNNSTDGLTVSDACHAGVWDQMVVKGSSPSADNGVLVSQGASIVLGPHFGTSEWGANLKCQSNGVIEGTTRGAGNWTATTHSYSYGCLVSADSGGVISINGILSGSVLAADACDNGTINLQGSELSCAGHPIVAKATRCGSINAANTTVLGCAPTGSTAFYMDTEGYIDSTDAVDDAETSRNPEVDLSDRRLSANKTIYVRTTGSDANDGASANTAFLTPSRAVEESKKFILGVYRCYVNVGEGVFDCAASLNPGCNEGAHIHWLGVSSAHTNLTINNIDVAPTALSGQLEYIDFDVPFAAGSGAAVGQFVLVKTTSGGSNPNLVKGCHEIVAWSTNVATVRCVRAAGVTTMPSGTITANTLTLVKTVLSFTGHTGFYDDGEPHAGTWDCMVLKGDLSHKGIWMRGGTAIALGINFGTSEWTDSLICQEGGRIHASGSTHSYALSHLVTADSGGLASLGGSILSGCWDNPVRAFDWGSVIFQSGQVICGGIYYSVFAMRAGSVIAINSRVEGSKPSGSIAYYATSGGTVVATGTYDDAEVSYATGVAPGGNGASVCH